MLQEFGNIKRDCLEHANRINGDSLGGSVVEVTTQNEEEH